MAKDVIINGSSYTSVPQVRIPLASGNGDAIFYDTSDATAQASHILTGKNAYGQGGLISGSMADNGDTSGTIATKTGTVTIPEGYTTGGTIELASSQKNLLVAGNIKSGVTLFGVAGSSMVVDTSIASGGATASNILNGYKAYVNGGQVTGTATVPLVSQDTSTHVLTIS